MSPCCDNTGLDFSVVAYRADYLRFMERGRTDYLWLTGASGYEKITQLG